MHSYISVCVLYVCMYVCMCIHIYIYAHIYTYRQQCTPAYALCVWLCMSVHIRMYVFINKQINKQIYIYAYVRPRTNLGCARLSPVRANVRAPAQTHTHEQRHRDGAHWLPRSPAWTTGLLWDCTKLNCRSKSRPPDCVKSRFTWIAPPDSRAEEFFRAEHCRELLLKGLALQAHTAMLRSGSRSTQEN